MLESSNYWVLLAFFAGLLLPRSGAAATIQGHGHGAAAIYFSSSYSSLRWHEMRFVFLKVKVQQLDLIWCDWIQFPHASLFALQALLVGLQFFMLLLLLLHEDPLQFCIRCGRRSFHLYPAASASVSSPSLRPRSLGLLLSCAMFLMLRVLMWMPRTALLLRADLIHRISMRLLSRRGCSNWDTPSWFVISGHNFSAFPVAVACWMHSLISQWELLVNGDVCGHENGDVVAGMLDACMSISLLFC